MLSTPDSTSKKARLVVQQTRRLLVVWLLLLSVVVASSSSYINILEIVNNSRSSTAAVAVATDLDNGQTQGRRKLSTYTLTFSYTGSVQQWVVPVGLATFTIDAYGAAGGDSPYALGGLGGYISVSNIAASSFVGKTLFVYVGGAGASRTAPGLGGGGGAVFFSNFGFSSGGGATDLRASLSDLSSRCLCTRTHTHTH